MQGEGYHAEQACYAFGLASIDAGQHRKGEHEESFLANAAQDRNGAEYDRGRVPRFRRYEQHDIRGRII